MFILELIVDKEEEEENTLMIGKGLESLTTTMQAMSQQSADAMSRMTPDESVLSFVRGAQFDELAMAVREMLSNKILSKATTVMEIEKEIERQIEEVGNKLGKMSMLPAEDRDQRYRSEMRQNTEHLNRLKKAQKALGRIKIRTGFDNQIKFTREKQGQSGDRKPPGEGDQVSFVRKKPADADTQGSGPSFTFTRETPEEW